MNICMVLSSLGMGGLEKQSVALANALSEKDGWHADLYILKSDCTIEGLVGPHTRLYKTLRTELPLRRYGFSTIVTVLRRHLKKHAYDVLIAEESYAGLVLCLASRNLNCTKARAIVMHTTILPNWRERLKNLLYRHVINTFAAKVFVSYAQQSHWIERYGIRGGCRVIQNSIDTGRFAPETVPDALRQKLKNELDIDDNDFVLVKIGRMEKEKNDRLLVEIFRTLAAGGAHCKLLIVGDGSERREIAGLVGELGLSHCIRLLGQQQDVRPFISISDAGILPSYTETFSLAALEIMSMACPMIMSDVGGAREIVEHGGNGLIFANGDKDAAVRCIRELMAFKDDGRLAAMAENARRSIVSKYSMHTMVDKYAGLIGEMGTASGLPRKGSGVVANQS